jgi:hypothetical protein
MANTKISALTSATTPLAGTEVLPIVQSGATVKVAVSDLTAGRAISATAVTATTGNFVVGTSGQGVDFSATPNTGTSELLDDYEIGTWTPADNSGAGLTFTGVTATYTKIGRLVSAQVYLTYPSTASIASASITGLPYTSASGRGWSAGAVFTDAASGKFAVVSQSSTNISFFNTADNSGATNVLFTGRFVILNFTYFV